MGPMPQDMLHSFDQLKVLNLSGNHLQNASLTLLDSIGSLEVSVPDLLFVVVVVDVSVMSSSKPCHHVHKAATFSCSWKIQLSILHHRRVFFLFSFIPVLRRPSRKSASVTTRNEKQKMNRIRKLHFSRCVHIKLN